MQIQEDRLASIFIVPFIQIALGVFLYISLLYGFRELILFVSILLGIGIIANIWCRVSSIRLSIEMNVDRSRVFPEESLNLHMKITNAKFLPVLAKVALHYDKHLVEFPKKDKIFDAHCGLLWFQSSHFRKTLIPQRRGLHRVGPPILAIGDLFGFYSREKKVKTSVEIVVYPRIVQVTPLSLPKREFYGVPGTRSPVEDPVYIYGTRDYQPGIPARRIHWKASARHSRIQEKLCEPTEQEKVMVLLEVSQFDESQASGEFEKIVETAASYLVWLESQGQAVGFATNGFLSGGGSSIIPIGRSPIQMSLILETLARVTMKCEISLPELLRKGYRLPRGVTCLSLAYGPGEATMALEASMCNRNIPILFVHAEKMQGLSSGRYPFGSVAHNMHEIRTGGKTSP